MDILLIDIATIASSRIGEVLDHPDNDIHAGEMETSVMLHLNESLVGPICPTNHRKYSQSLIDYFDFMELTADGYWGFPEAATKKKGQQIMDLLLTCTLAYLAKYDEVKKQVCSKKPGWMDEG